MKTYLVAAGLAVLSMPLAAQEAAVTASVETPAVAAAPATVPVVRTLPASTLVTVSPLGEISSKKIKVGDKIAFTVVNDVVENGVVAIPRGSPVEASVTFKTGKAVGGKSGKFDLSFDRVTVGNTTYAMRGTHHQEGKGNTVAAVFATWLVSGRSAVMTPGQTASAFTAETIPY